MEKKYKYDVAFSFLAQDQNLVMQVNDLIKDRLNTFVYSEQQKELAGTDGELTFSKVFAEEARVVVVFYRGNWGETKWTRIEQTAIRGRAFDEGYDFTLFVPLGSNLKVPSWLPKTRLWYSLEHFKMEGLAVVIDALVQQTGGTIKERSALSDAASFVKEAAIEKERGEFLQCYDGVNAALKEVEALASEIETIVQKIEADTGLKMLFYKAEKRISVSTFQGSVTINWNPTCCNMVHDAVLNIDYADGLVSYHPNAKRTYDEPRRVKALEYGFTYVIQGDKLYGWCLKSGDKRFITSKELADFSIKNLIEVIKKTSEKQR
jgi:hypothetical protein